MRSEEMQMTEPQHRDDRFMSVAMSRERRNINTARKLRYCLIDPFSGVISFSRRIVFHQAVNVRPITDLIAGGSVFYPSRFIAGTRSICRFNVNDANASLLILRVCVHCFRLQLKAFHSPLLQRDAEIYNSSGSALWSVRP